MTCFEWIYRCDAFKSFKVIVYFHVQYFSVYCLETNATVTDALLLSPAVASAHDTALWHGRINLDTQEQG